MSDESIVGPHTEALTTPDQRPLKYVQQYKTDCFLWSIHATARTAGNR
jgi:hypothetical protein